MIVHHRLRLLAFPTRASAARMLVLADHEISRFPSKERAHMPVSKSLTENECESFQEVADHIPRGSKHEREVNA